MPVIDKASIGVPMVLQPTVVTKTGMALKNPSAISLASKSSASLPLTKESKPSKASQFVPSTPSLLGRELKSDDNKSKSPLHPVVTVKTPFPVQVDADLTETPPPVPPKDAPRPRHQSKASIALTSVVNAITPKKSTRSDSSVGIASAKQSGVIPNPQSSSQSLSTKDTFAAATKQREAVNLNSFETFTAYTPLLDACKARQVEKFESLSKSYLEALNCCLQDLDSQLPRALSKSTQYLLAKSDFDFSSRVFQSSLKATTSAEELVYRVYDSSKALWDSFSRVLQSLQSQDMSVAEGLEELLAAGISPQPRRVHFDDTQEVEEVAAILASSFKNSSSASIKSAKHSLSDYFHKFSLSRVSFKRRKAHSSHADSPMSPQVDVAAPRSSDVSGSTSSSASSTLLSGPRPQKTSVPANSPPYHRFGLRESHIFCSAASTFVARLPSPAEAEAGKPIPPFSWAWWVPLPKDQGIYTQIKVQDADSSIVEKSILAAGSFPYLVRHILQHIDDPGNADFVDAFFMFFRQYGTPLSLLEILLGWYQTMSPAAKAFVRSHKSAFRLRAKTQIIKLLTRWLEHYWLEKEDEAVRKPLLEFTHNVVANDLDLPSDLSSILAVSLCRTAPSRVTQLTRRFQSQVAKAENDQQSHPPTQFALQLKHMSSMVSRGQNIKHIDILEFCHEGGAEELARAVTLLESDYFHTISPESIAGWRGSKFELLKPWDRFVNTLSCWVVACVVNHYDEKDRVAAYELMVDVARSCKSMRNFSSAKSITCSLELKPITRLIGTVNRVSQYHKEYHAQLSKFFSCKDGYAVEISQTRPAVPLPETIRYGVTKCDVEAKKHPEASRVKQSGYMDMIYYEKIARVIRGLENIYGAYSIPRQEVVLQWIELIRRPYEHYSWDENEERLFSESCKIVPQSSNEKRKPKF